MANIFFDFGEKNNNSRNDRERLIFLEGTDDAYFIDHILDGMKADASKVGIVTVGGIGEFRAKIKGFLKTSSYTQGRVKAICIVRDADEDFYRAEAEISKVFLDLLDVEVSHGKVVLKNGIAYGFFILPGLDQHGDLERLCMHTVSGTGLESKSEDFFSGLENPPVDQVFKRKSQVYLAGYKGDLCRGAGRGFKYGHFNDSHESLDPLKEFLSLFISDEVKEVEGVN